MSGTGSMIARCVANQGDRQVQSKQEVQVMSGDSGPILLILPSLSPRTTQRELKQFVREGLSEAGYRGFALLMAVARCSILRLTDRTTGRSELHGMVQIRPAKTAFAAMNALQGKEFRGAKVEVRRYQPRSGNGFYDLPPETPKERRRGQLYIELLDC